MRHQERIYIQSDIGFVRNKDILNVNMSSDICTFNEPEFNVTGATKIFTGITSGNTGVYIISTATTINLNFIFTSDTASFTANSASFKYEIYKFNSQFSAFSANRIYHVDAIPYSGFSGTSAITQSIPVSGLSLDGDYLIKGFYEYKSCTDYLSRLNTSYDTSFFKTGTTYGYYNPRQDFYFIAITSADEPTFRNVGSSSSSPNLFQQIIIPTDGQTIFSITNNVIGDFVVTLNGLVLANNYDYTFSGNNITLTAETISDDILTIIYTTNGSNNLTTDNINVLSVNSGTTNNQGSNKIYFNTTSGKYEIFTTTIPITSSNILVMINGVTLANNIDYYQSTSNSKRLILEGNIIVGDIITIVYFAYPDVINGISTNTPSINWSIINPPQLNNGLFVIEVGNSNTFTSLVATATTPYIIGQTLYNATVTITGSVGTELYYRVKNNKKYVSITGDIIESIIYSEIVPITIETNSINSY